MSAVPVVELEIARGRLQSLVDEAATVLTRTAFSPIVREAKDFACAILGPDGRTVVQSAQSIPVFLGTMPVTAAALLAELPLDELAPGDVIATNDPWLGTGHLSDLTIMTPVSVGGAVVGLAAIVAHLPDIGGRVPFAMDASQVFEEGLRLPPLKLATAAGLDPMLERIVRANVRLPDEVLGDIWAMLGACRSLAAGLAALTDGLGVPFYEDVCSELERRSERYVRGAIGGLADGVYPAELKLEGVHGHAFELRLAIRIEGDGLVVDYAGSSPQLETAGINACLSYSTSYTLYALKCLLAPDVPFNHGLTRPIDVVAPPATVVNSRFPAAGDARNVVGHVLPTVVIRAMEAVLPERCIGESASPRPIVYMSGWDAERERMAGVPVLVMGGLGARATKDGLSTVAFPSNTETVSIEMTEASSPVFFEESELVPDSGGPGAQRGGLGRRVRLRCLTDRMDVAAVVQRLTVAPRGIAGGGDGSVTKVAVNEEPITQPGRVIGLARGDVLEVSSSGGGGYGPPAERAAAKVEQDLIDGYVTADATAAHGQEVRGSAAGVYPGATGEVPRLERG